MNLYLYPDNKKGPEKFPEHLSQFFEQYRGYGEASEVAQVEAILDLDLSLFQKYGSDETDSEWLSVEEMVSLITRLRSAILAKPDFHLAIKHTGIPAREFRTEFLHAQKNKDDKKLVTLLKRWQNTPDSEFPPDTKYLSDGKLLFDLGELEKILLFLRKMGAKKVALVYR